MTGAAIRAAFLAACEDELAAPKPGNVHVHAGGHGMTVSDFRASAAAAAGPLCREGATLGERIIEAVAATRAAVRQNTNLGIVLLCAPLAMAAERPGRLRENLTAVLATADLADADLVFRAIALASPGGLGEAPRHDVRGPALVPLSVAMADAADRDRIARQWTTGFDDVFLDGLATYADGLQRWPDRSWATLLVFLTFLAAFPDSHVVRKLGAAAAETARSEAVAMHRRLLAASAPAALLPGLLDWDRSLKRRGVNPGTSADLTVATIFANRLGPTLRERSVDG